MSTVPQSPDEKREARILELRREAEKHGRVEGLGVRPAGAPFPQASPETGYYGIPLLKEPQWTWQIPLYFAVGGAAGSAGVIGALADWVGDDYELARDARWMALGGAVVSGALLTWDLGRPSRFLNMLRVFKPQSPMSMGAWILTAFGSAAGAASFADFVGERWGRSLPVRVIGGLGKLGSLAMGGPFHNYTGVLIGATVIPAWNKNITTLPIHFGMSGVQSAVCLLELMGHSRSRALNLLGIGSAFFETWEGAHLEGRSDRELDPLKHGPTGWLTRAGGTLSGPVPLALRVMSILAGERQSRTMRKWAAVSGIVGSLCTRYGWMHAGHASARDWRIPLEIPSKK
ncbi:MAG TPA: NrfD/PsrC family molybdoenzyme membrane anchor subunit, partial [Ramlibacter sp.]|nr:NrfD/PsrC family molybdoenzyme membrane anchor subunit [Ramlibacter sp.]